MPDLSLSVVIATYNRADTMRRTLECIANQSLDPSRYEVIVVDDGSPDNTREVVEEFAAKVPFDLRYLRHANHGPGYTQNQGLFAARAPFVLFMADDIWMSRGALAAHVAFHEARPGPEVAVLGQVKQSPEAEQSVFLRAWDPFRFSDMADADELPYYRFWACNVSASREFVLRHGPFRPQMGLAGYAAHEDSELGYRLSRAGMRLYYCPEAIGFHHHVATLEGVCKRGYMQGLNFPAFREQVGQPEIAVVYHWIDWSTLGDHLRACFGPRRKHLAPIDRALPVLFGRYMLRGLAFNAVTMRLVWAKAAAWAERYPAVAKLMRPAFYRGMIAYHFFKGCRDGRAMIKGMTRQQPKQV